MKDLKYFNRDQINKILSDKLKTTNYSIYLFILTLAYTGARVTEIIGNEKIKGLRVLDIKEILEKENSYYTITIQTIKQKKETWRNLFLIPLLKIELLSFISSQKLKPKDKIFNISRKTAYNWTKKACEIAGFKDDRVHPHTFRHSFAINSLTQEKPVPIQELKRVLGHSSISNTIIYSELIAQDSKIYWKDFEY